MLPREGEQDAEGGGRRAHDLLQGLLREIYVRARINFVCGDRGAPFAPSCSKSLPPTHTHTHFNQGIELEKQLLACLKELSRLFNDSSVLEQYQVAALKAAAGQTGRCVPLGSLVTYIVCGSRPARNQPASLLGLTHHFTLHASTDGGDDTEQGLLAEGTWKVDARFLPAVKQHFRSLLRQLSALGWGLSQQRELKVGRLYAYIYCTVGSCAFVGGV